MMTGATAHLFPQQILFDETQKLSRDTSCAQYISIQTFDRVDWNENAESLLKQGIKRAEKLLCRVRRNL
jgi:hypothetical protein